MTTEFELISHAKAGCSRSRGELLEKYRNYLKTLARVQLHGPVQAKADASDIVQDVFLRAHEAFGGFRGTTGPELSGWLQRILASQLMDLYRYHNSQKRSVVLEQQLHRHLDQSSEALSQVLVHPGPTPSELTNRRERAVLMANAMEKLPADYQMVIQLRHIHRLAYADIAREMNRSIDSVKKLWVRALAQLQRAVEESE